MRQQRSKSQVDVSVVIPAHNEEGNIAILLDQFAELLRNASFSLEVVLVDDGSTDGTLKAALETQRTHRFLRLVSHPHRRGLTEALRAGFAVARGGIIVFYPADRQFHPSDIPRMVAKVREGCDMVTGRKIGEYDKRVVSGIYNRLSRWLFPSIPVTDLNSVKAFRRELTDVFDYRHDWHRFWVAIVAEAGYRVGEVDVTLYKRRAGRSKFGFWRIPGGVLDLLAVKFQYHTMRRPLWYFGMTGSILLAIAFLIGLWALYERFIQGIGYRPLLYLVMTLGISGIVFFALGFLAESVAGIREQLEMLRGQPRHSVYQPPRSERSGPKRDSSSSRDRDERRSRSGRDRRGQQRDSRDSRRRQPDRRRRDSHDATARGSETGIRRRVLDDKPKRSEENQSETSKPPAPPADHRNEEAEQRKVGDDDLFAGASHDDKGEGGSIERETDTGERHESKEPEDSTPPASREDRSADDDAPKEHESSLFGRRNRR